MKKDCVWKFLNHTCEEKECPNTCNTYISINSEVGKGISNKYQKEKSQMLTDFIKEWRQKMNEYTINQ